MFDTIIGYARDCALLMGWLIVTVGIVLVAIGALLTIQNIISAI